MSIRNGNKQLGATLIACVALALGAGCGRGGDEGQTPRASDTETPALPTEVREMLGAAAEAEGEDEDVVALLKSKDGLAQMAQIGAEIAERIGTAYEDADLMTADGRAELADKLEAIVKEYRARIPELDPAVRDKITEMVDDIENGAADLRSRN